MAERKTTKITKAPKVVKTEVKEEKAVPKAVKPKATEEKEAPKTTKPKTSGKYIFAVGRRKTATAKVRLFDGDGNIVINGRALKDYIGWMPWQRVVSQPLTVVGAEKNFDIVAKVLGGGLHAQAEAVALGIARALVIKDETFKKVLRTNGLLTRDSLMKERKKPGLKRARRAPQWSKR